MFFVWAKKAQKPLENTSPKNQCGRQEQEQAASAVEDMMARWGDKMGLDVFFGIKRCTEITRPGKHTKSY